VEMYIDGIQQNGIEWGRGGQTLPLPTKSQTFFKKTIDKYNQLCYN
jgi:hypothetical protein